MCDHGRFSREILFDHKNELKKEIQPRAQVFIFVECDISVFTVDLFIYLLIYSNSGFIHNR